ncbi:MAG TPA: zf-HC2 domain-containing protein [Vicinamibacterales bacterium]|nr:zf-HC2 domain-containing protein [Vicinamibacterales bacterium]
MCNQREQLIGYVYDECSAAERAAVQQHLDACAECRTEIAALRSVRDDLQAWDVPDHESVWKPFMPAPAPAWWQQVPRWAMAAAAGAVIVSGAAGGAAAIALMPPVQAAPLVATSAPAGATQVGLTANDLRALEQRIEAKIQTEVSALNGRVQLASSRPLPASLTAALQTEFDRQLTELRTMNDTQRETINRIYANMKSYQMTFDTRHELLKRSVGNLAAAVAEQSQGR